MKRSAFCGRFFSMTAAVIGLCVAKAMAGGDGWVQIADSEVDFSNVQGQGGWYYLYAATTGADGELAPMANYSATPGCGCGNTGPLWHFAPDVCFCGQEFCFIGRSLAHGDTQGVPHVPVRRFVAPQFGRYRLDLGFAHAGGCGGGNPMRLEIRHAGTVLWAANANANGSIQTGTVEIIANAGDAIEMWSVMLASECGGVHQSTMKVFAADCNGDGANDYAQIQAGELPDYNGNWLPDCCEWGEECVLGDYPIQWRISDGGNGHWYQRVSSNLVWSDAQAQCDEIGGHLVTLTSSDENQFALTRLGVSPIAYSMGAVQLPDACEPGCGWGWVTGEVWAYTNWFPGEPNNANGSLGEDVSKFWGTTGQWNDTGLGGGGAFICEWSADCDGDGDIDLGQVRSRSFAHRDANGNGIPDCCESPAPCPQCMGDITGNGEVNSGDLGELLGAWGTDGQSTSGGNCDLNGDGVVSGNDLGTLLLGWGPCS